MAIEKIAFEGATGHELAGVIETPAGEARGTVLFAHCFTCGKDIKSAYWIAKALVDHGLAVMRFDFTGLGESAGDFSETNFTTNVADLLNAADALRVRGRAPTLLVGHSLGGAAALVVARHVPELRGVVTIAAPSSTGHLAATLARMAPELGASGAATVEIGGQRIVLRDHLLDDLQRPHLEDAIATLDRPLLVMHSPLDRTAGIEHGERIFAAARQPKSFVCLAGMDHLMSRADDARHVGALIAAWSATCRQDSMNSSG